MIITWKICSQNMLRSIDYSYYLWYFLLVWALENWKGFSGCLQHPPGPTGRVATGQPTYWSSGSPARAQPCSPRMSQSEQNSGIAQPLERKGDLQPHTGGGFWLQLCRVSTTQCKYDRERAVTSISASQTPSPFKKTHNENIIVIPCLRRELHGGN